MLVAMYRLPMSRKLSDVEIYDRLHASLLALGGDEGETIAGDTAIKAARRTVVMLQAGLLTVMDKATDQEPVSVEPYSDPR